MSWYVANSLNQLLDEINASAPGRNKASDGSIGDPAHSARESEHNPCDDHSCVCARDFTHDPAGGFNSYDFAQWLVDRCVLGQENRCKYVISNGRIASASQGWVWRPYDGSNPHDHHVHVSVAHPQSLFDDGSAWGWHGSPPPIDQGDLDLSDSQYDTIMRRLDELEHKVDSNGTGQNKIWEETEQRFDTVDNKVDSNGSGQNRIWELTEQRFDSIDTQLGNLA